MLKAITAAKDIIDQVRTAEQNTAQEDRRISSDTLQELPGSTRKTNFIVTLFAAVKECETDPNAVIPPVDEKYSINGKVLAQAVAQAAKAGQEYVLAEMAVITSQKDIHELQNLIGKYTGKGALYAAAEARFYDSFLSMQTSVGIQMRNMAWAYKYWALEDSSLVLDSQKTVAQFWYDVYAIDDGVYHASLNLSPSGLYANIQDGKAFYFTRGPQSARVSYDIGEVHIDGSFGDGVRAYPTVITKWTIQLLDGEELDLSPPESVHLVWRVYARFDWEVWVWQTNLPTVAIVNYAKRARGALQESISYRESWMESKYLECSSVVIHTVFTKNEALEANRR